MAVKAVAAAAAAAVAAKSIQLCLSLCDPRDGGLPFPSPMHESEK